ncbi:Methionyl-tRNA formyltransferase, mitochondrial [Erysiphe neolycopersici]|uniref:methionyl-tRNA formyltransferase n=1 Tax=Erysiphe neolycopersici TaxID=212602 RepID=A0A420HY24_9PEZI|nr:Methionyl-tRNA formyltransferase, mitochondrial [Erysiphe neolycopersici]
MAFQFHRRIVNVEVKYFAKVLARPVFYSTKVSEPLRILFCGSDEFSAASLKALQNEKTNNPGLIKSIDVLCRPGKPVGRGLKNIAEVPIKAIAQDIGLQVHETEDLNHWELPRPEGNEINLIIAVSFGLFIPARILNLAKYGGLNLHPSILPNFRGAAPLERTLTTGYGFSGVTLQTLDHKQFDRGVVIDQTKPWLNVPKFCTYARLLEIVTPVAAEMLVKGLNQRLFVPPLKSVGWVPPKNEKLIYANKITPEDKKIPWGTKSGAYSAVQTYNALGCLWSYVFISNEDQKRLKFNQISIDPQHTNIYIGPVSNPNTIKEKLAAFIGRPIHYIVVPILPNGKQAILYFENEAHKGCINFLFPSRADKEGFWSSIKVGEITIEGKKATTAQQALNSISKMRGEWKLDISNNYQSDSENYLIVSPLQN